MSKLKRLHDRVKELEAGRLAAAQKIEELEREKNYLGRKLDDFIAYGEALEARLIPYEGTPANRRVYTGEEDPFANYLDKERADLTLGHLTDDEIANAIFMNYNVFPPSEDLLSGKGTMPIVYMTGGKERIRWLSRQVEKLRSELLANATNTPVQSSPEA